MNDFFGVDRIKDYLLHNIKPAYLTTNQKELRVRCPFCGDSKNNPYHAHLYINLEPPFKFYCQKCNTAGILDSKNLKEFDIYNSEITLDILKLNKEVSNNSLGKKQITKQPTLKINLNDSEIETRNVNYFNNRFNLSFDREELTNKYKVILNPTLFLKENRISIENGVVYDFENSIGFLSSQNSYVIFRDITGKQKRRYFNLNLYPDDNLPFGKIYNIHTEIDLLKPTKLIMAEGIFDIIGVYNYFYDENTRKNSIFAACCGKGYKSLISYYVHKGILNPEIIIYSDADVPIQFYKDLKNQSPYIFNNITVYYNNIEKDYGIPRDRVELRKVII